MSNAKKVREDWLTLGFSQFNMYYPTELQGALRLELNTKVGERLLEIATESQDFDALYIMAKRRVTPIVSMVELKDIESKVTELNNNSLNKRFNNLKEKIELFYNEKLRFEKYISDEIELARCGATIYALSFIVNGLVQQIKEDIL